MEKREDRHEDNWIDFRIYQFKIQYVFYNGEREDRHEIIGSTLEFADLFHTVAVRPARLSFLDMAKTS